MFKFGFIGMGNMGYAMLKSTIKVFRANELMFTCPSKERREQVSKETGVAYAESNAECANNCRMLVLAVKPQVYDVVLKNIHDIVTDETILISLAPSISMDYIKMKLGRDIRIVRAMPNTSALIGEGMTGISYDVKAFSFEERDLLEQFFNSFGKVVTVPENLMSAVVCASGSSPAYVYMFIEALADSVVKYGIPRKEAYKLVAQTVMGSAKMVLETMEHPGKLKDDVCSPGGTTIKGVSALEEYGFRNAIIKATDACYAACSPQSK